MKEYDVVAMGELLIDFTENDVSSQGNPLMEANPGGAPCNSLAMLSKFGKKTALISRVGNDMFGNLLKERVKSVGVDIDWIQTDYDIPTTLAFVHTAEDGDRSFSFYRKPGADVMLRSDGLDEELFKNTKIFHFGSLSMTDEEVNKTTLDAIAMAKKHGVTVSFDPNYRPALWDDEKICAERIWKGIAECDVLKVSDDEILFLTGKEDMDEGIAVISEKTSAKLICATLGKEGSIAYYNGKRYFAKPFLNDNTIETTGAGDTFDAGMLNAVIDCGLSNMTDKDIENMLNTANAAASIITTRRGALAVMPEKEEVEALVKTRA